MRDEDIGSNAKITLDDLAAYSPWPSRLLGAEKFTQKHKNPSEVIREFGDEKWGRLLELFSSRPNITLAEVELMEKDLNATIPIFDWQLGFYLDKVKASDLSVLKYMEEILNRYSNGASCLVELGAGYGNKIFNLSETPLLKSLDLIALEYTKTGCDLIKLIASHTKQKVKVDQCDFNTLNFGNVAIPENAIIFTSYALHYVTEMRDDFVQRLCQLKPKVVIHFEPCYDYLDKGTIHGLLCRRYMEVNGYTRNISSCIDAGCKRAGAHFKSQKNVYGANPFLPFSIIEWTPF